MCMFWEGTEYVKHCDSVTIRDQLYRQIHTPCPPPLPHTHTTTTVTTTCFCSFHFPSYQIDTLGSPTQTRAQTPSLPLTLC